MSFNLAIHTTRQWQQSCASWSRSRSSLYIDTRTVEITIAWTCSNIDQMMAIFLDVPLDNSATPSRPFSVEASCFSSEKTTRSLARTYMRPTRATAMLFCSDRKTHNAFLVHSYLAILHTSQCVFNIEHPIDSYSTLKNVNSTLKHVNLIV